jgi:hypothetical protein
MTAVSNITLDDEFDRTKKYFNKCGFDDATLRRRDVEMRELQKTYPDVCSSHLELCWNFCEFTPKEEQDRIIASKEFEQKPKNKRNTGGIIKSAIKIQTQEEYEAEKLELELKEKLEIKE